MQQITEQTNPYLAGKQLYGDDFNQTQIESWYEDEKEGYASLAEYCQAVADPKKYSFHELNQYYGFRYLTHDNYQQVLGIGSAYGEELAPIIDKIEQVTILEPSEKFVRDRIYHVPATYVKPESSGNLPFTDASFNLITCFGVLHHIPNVSFVMQEIYRCLAPQGMVLIREPIISLGDWSKPRIGLTKRERGIPVNYFDGIVDSCQFQVKQKSLCIFPPVQKISRKLGIIPYNNRFVTVIDRIASELTKFNLRYHRTNTIQKFSPTSVYYVLSK